MHGHHSLPRIERYTFELKLQSTSFTAQQQTHVLSAAPEQAEPNYSGILKLTVCPRFPLGPGPPRVPGSPAAP